MEKEAFSNNPFTEINWNSSPSSDPPVAGDRNGAVISALIGRFCGICNSGESSPLSSIYQSSDSSSFGSAQKSCMAGKDATAAGDLSGRGHGLGRKRKEASKEREREDPLSFTISAARESPKVGLKFSNMILEEECSNSKRAKPTKAIGAEKEDGNAVKKQEKEKATKPLESPQVFLHVRARRGQATDSHSLAERVRREKISERMKFLQELVPGCNKVAGKAAMLDEIINYVQSLQSQVEFLSMKLATVNPQLDFSVYPMYPLQATSSSFAFENSALGASLMADGSLETRNGSFWVDDLHGLVQMSFQNQENVFFSQSFQGA